MSERSDVIDEIMLRIKTNIPNSFRDKEAFNEEDAYPIANVLIGESKTINKVEGVHKYVTALPVSIEAINKNSEEDPFPDIESLLGKIKSAILTDNDLKGKCKEFTYDGDSEAARQYGGSIVSVSADFTFNYVEDHC